MLNRLDVVETIGAAVEAVAEGRSGSARHWHAVAATEKIASTMSCREFFTGRPMRPLPEHGATRSAISSHSSSVMTPWVVRQVLAFKASV